MSKYLKDKRIEIFEQQVYTDSIGNNVDKYFKSRGKFWAYTRLLSMDEYNRYGLHSHDEERLFIINYHNDVKPSDRIIYKDKEYTITKLDTYEDNKQDIKIYAEKVTNRRVN